jgi:hypothetical protein
LFFDTYEQTGALIDPWLRSVLEGQFGVLPANLVVVIAGRKPLDKASSAPFLAVVAEAPLTSFGRDRGTAAAGRQGHNQRGRGD